MAEKIRRYRVHFNRIAMQRKDPLVWSVQLSDRCLHVRQVHFRRASLATEFRPEKKNNPRAFFAGRGIVEQQGRRGGYSMKRFLEDWFGIHLHTWRYITEVDDFDNVVFMDDLRECACGATQILIEVPAAPGAFASWVDL